MQLTRPINVITSLKDISVCKKLDKIVLPLCKEDSSKHFCKYVIKISFLKNNDFLSERIIFSNKATITLNLNFLSIELILYEKSEHLCEKENEPWALCP